MPPSVTSRFSSVGKYDSLRGTISEPAVVKKKGTKEMVVSIDKRPVNPSLSPDLEIRLEGALGAEVSLVVLDIYDMILSFQNPKSYASAQAAKMFALLCKFFEVHQSELVLAQLFGTIKAFIYKVGCLFSCSPCSLLPNFVSQKLSQPAFFFINFYFYFFIFYF